jgi:hypothetical protein
MHTSFILSTNGIKIKTSNGFLIVERSRVLVEVDCRGLDAVNSFAALNQLKGR